MCDAEKTEDLLTKIWQAIKQKILQWMAFVRFSFHFSIFITVYLKNVAMIYFLFLSMWKNFKKIRKKSLDEESAFSKIVIRRWLHDSSSMQVDGTLSPQTAQEEHFIYLSLPYLALYTSLWNLPEKNCLSAKSSVWKGRLFRFHQPWVIFTPTPLPRYAPAHQSLPLPETSLCQFVLS